MRLLLILICAILCACKDQPVIHSEIHNSGSMWPTIKAGNEVKWIEFGDTEAIKRSQLVVITSPTSGVDLWVRRVIGLEGETIIFEEEGCRIDGRKWSWNDLGVPKPSMKFDVVEKVSIDLPLGTYFLIGDNLANALDSRKCGPISRRSIIGKVVDVGNVPGQQAAEQ